MTQTDTNVWKSRVAYVLSIFLDGTYGFDGNEIHKTEIMESGKK